MIIISSLSFQGQDESTKQSCPAASPAGSTVPAVHPDTHLFTRGAHEEGSQRTMVIQGQPGAGHRAGHPRSFADCRTNCFIRQAHSGRCSRSGNRLRCPGRYT